MSIYDKVKTNACEFFCLNEDEDDETCRRWNERRRRLLYRKCGKLKDDAEGTSDVTDASDGISSAAEVDEEVVSKVPVYKLTWKQLSYITGTVKKKFVAAKERQEPHPEDVEVPEVPVATVSELEPAEDVWTDGGPDDENENKDAEVFLQHVSFPKQRVCLGGTLQTEKTWSAQGDRSPKPTIKKNIIESIVENSDRKLFGLGFLTKLFSREVKSDLPPHVKKAIDDLDDFRPYFTYWVTAVQVFIMIIALCAYGFGPSGFSTTAKVGTVLVPSLSLQQIEYYETDSFWIGPRAADLVRLGAKFTPCMRKDKHVFDDIALEKAQEKESACCVRNDESGCVQTTREKCSDRLSTWIKWKPDFRDAPTLHNGFTRRTSGSVCGQDPRYCEEPASVHPYEWPDDITKWPVCRKPVLGKAQAHRHMACQLIGRPCCIGTYGSCEITTREYCDFVNGHFHDEATLCSQVSCLSDVCGMVPFITEETPDQISRIFTSIFIHAGILHLIATILIQLYIMRDVEKFVGLTRTATIYMLSGVAGNLASGIFVPYRAEVGPSGCQFGILASMIVEVINSWEHLENPKKPLLRLCAVAFLLFILGLLPFIDNYAHIFGFITGLGLSFALLPYITLTVYNRRSRLIQICVSILLVFLLFIILIVLFYVSPIYECEFCRYLNCISFGEDWCMNHGIKIQRKDRL